MQLVWCDRREWRPKVVFAADATACLVRRMKKRSRCFCGFVAFAANEQMGDVCTRNKETVSGYAKFCQGCWKLIFLWISAGAMLLAKFFKHFAYYAIYAIHIPMHIYLIVQRGRSSQNKKRIFSKHIWATLHRTSVLLGDLYNLTGVAAFYCVHMKTAIFEKLRSYCTLALEHSLFDKQLWLKS